LCYSFSVLSWKAWCYVDYCSLLSNSIWCSISMLCSDNADCVTYFSLISRWCSFIRKLIILPVSPIYTCPQEQNILYILELSGGSWSLGFLKIYPIFLGSLKFGYCVSLICLPIRSVVLLTYGRMDRILSSDCVSETVVLFAYLLIVLLYLFCRVRFSVRLILNDWVLSVDILYQRWWKFYVQVNQLQTVFVVMTRHIGIYLCWFSVYLKV